MVTVVAIVNIRAGQAVEYEATMQQAAPLIAAAPGYMGHELLKCQDTPGRYLLLEHWESREAHLVGFRGLPVYAEWKRLTHPFYDPFPTVEHYEPCLQFSV